MSKARNSVNDKAKRKDCLRLFGRSFGRLFGRSSAAAVVLFNVFAWALFALPQAVPAQTLSPSADAAAIVAAMDIPGLSADDICVGGMLHEGQGPHKSVCPQCFPLGHAGHALILPGEPALPSFDGQKITRSASTADVTPEAALGLPWQARAPPTIA